MRTSLALLCAAAVGALSCSSGGSAESPLPASVEPATGLASAPTRVVIRGDGFLARPSEQQSGGGAAVDTRHRAWLGEAELEAVTWRDVHTLEATVPAGLPAGPKRLVVENALGRRGMLDGAFEVIAPEGAALEATLQAAPETSNVGQPITVTLAVRNAGGSTVTAIAPDALTVGGPGADGAAVDGPSPASVDLLEPGAPASFTWSVIPAVPGALTFSATAHGVDGVTSGDVASPAAEASASAQLPAQLTATIAASRTTASVGQPFTITLTLANGGASSAEVASVQLATSGPATSCGAVSPALPQSVATGGVLRLEWTCSATASGSLSIGATVAATDGTSGAPLSASPTSSAVVAIQSPAALTAALAVQGSPATVAVGQALSVTLTVRDTGEASATVTAVQPSASPAAGATCGAPAPSPPQGVAGLGTRTFSWSCTALQAGSLTLGASVTGTAANTGAALQAAAPGVSLSVVRPAALTATIAASRAAIDVGQPVTATFTLTNGGAATASIAAVTVSTTGTAPAACDPPAPAPAPIPPGGSSTFTWSCTPSARGTLALSATATGTDAVSGAPLSATPAAPASVTVQTPAALAVGAFTASRAVADVNQPVSVTLVLANSGEATASLTALAPTFGPTGAGTCTAATPAPPRSIAGGATLQLVWSCTGTAAGTASLGATVTASDANSGAALAPAVTPLPLTVQLPASLSAAIAAEPTSVSVSQPVSITLTVTNGGGATATLSSVTPRLSGTATASCGGVAPATPVTLAGGASATFRWTCTPATAGALALGADVTGADTNTLASLAASPDPAATVTVTPAGTFAVTAFTAERATANLDQPVAVTLTLGNAGAVPAEIASLQAGITPLALPGCTAVLPAPPLTIPVGGSATFGWSCAASTAGAYALQAAVVSVPTLAAAPAQIPVTVQTPALLPPATLQTGAATLGVGQAIAVSLPLSNAGEADAVVTAVTLGAGGAGGVSCGPSTPAAPQTLPGGASLTFGWTCTGTAAGTVTLSATVSAADANTGAVMSPAVAPADLSVQTTAALTAALTPSATSVAVNTPVTLTLALQNTSEATARVTSVLPTTSAGGNNPCSAAAPATPQDVPGGATASFTWSCAPRRAGSYTLGATVTVSDLNTGAPVTVTVPTVIVTAN